MRQTVSILGIPVDNLSNLDTLDCLDQFIQQGGFHQVATANADFIINAMQDRELRHILCAADLVTPDGMPIVWASRLLGSPLPERVTGADLVPKLAELAAQKGYRIYMLGARPEVAQRARKCLEAKYPGIRIVGCVSPKVKVLSQDNVELLRDILRANPDILLVACGNPKQEKWINLNRQNLQHVPVCIGVGGTFDLIAGEAPRAPLWMQRVGLEWLFRLGHDPKRLWRRYVKDLVFFSFYLVRQLWAMRPHPNRNHASVTSTRIEEYSIVQVQRGPGRQPLSEFNKIALDALHRSPHLIMTIEDRVQIDAAMLATLVVLSKQARAVGREVRIVCTDRRLMRMLRKLFIDERVNFCATLSEALTANTESRFQVTMRCENEHALYSFCGVADSEQIETVAHQFNLLPPSICEIDIDLRGATHIDCSMLSALLGFVYHTKSTGQRVRLVTNPMVREILKSEGILDEFVLAESPLPCLNLAPRELTPHQSVDEC